jgi:hypothetical protein
MFIALRQQEKKTVDDGINDVKRNRENVDLSLCLYMYIQMIVVPFGFLSLLIDEKSVKNIAKKKTLFIVFRCA